MRWRPLHIAIVASLALSACGRSGIEATPSPASAPTRDPAPYQADLDEGLGASIAILVDTSGSMAQPTPGDGRPKYVVARAALARVLAQTEAFAAARPELPVKLAVYGFSSTPYQVSRLLPYDRARVEADLARLPGPGGGTAIGEALAQARPELYRGGTFRKHMLVLTDGFNTAGRAPDRVAREIHRRSQGAVKFHFVAFDVDARIFDFVSDLGGEVVSATSATELEAALQEIYQGRILAEAMEPDETRTPSHPTAEKGTP